MTHNEAKRITGLLMERWPSQTKWTQRFIADWVEWLKPLTIDEKQADACLRQCSAEGQSPLMDAHRPKILDRLRRCQFGERAPVDDSDCETCDGNRIVSYGNCRYGPCPKCRAGRVE